MTETERALRAATCEGCRNNWPLVAERAQHRKPFPINTKGSVIVACTSNGFVKRLLPLFQQAVAGAYAAAAKHFPRLPFLCSCGFKFKDEGRSISELWREHILALTPADALSKPPSMDDVENCSEAEYKLTADARQAQDSTGAGVADGAELRTFKTAPVERPNSRDGVPFVSEELDKKYSHVEMSAAIAFAEAKARLEGRIAEAGDAAEVTATSKFFSDYFVRRQGDLQHRISELEAAARTPDSTKEQG